MKILTEDQLAEVDRIIEKAPIQTTWASGYDDQDGSVEVDDAEGTLRCAAREVRKYLASLETKEAANA